MTNNNQSHVPLSVLNECLARVAEVETTLFANWENSPEGDAEAEGKMAAFGMLEACLDKIQRDLSDLGITVDFPRTTNI